MEQKKEVWFIIYANFCGAKISTMADFNLRNMTSMTPKAPAVNVTISSRVSWYKLASSYFWEFIKVTPK